MAAAESNVELMETGKSSVRPKLRKPEADNEESTDKGESMWSLFKSLEEMTGQGTKLSCEDLNRLVNSMSSLIKNIKGVIRKRSFGNEHSDCDKIVDKDLKQNNSYVFRKGKKGHAKLLKDKNRKYTLGDSTDETITSDNGDSVKSDSHISDNDIHWGERVSYYENRGLSVSDAINRVRIELEGAKFNYDRKRMGKEQKISKPWSYGGDKVQSFDDFLEDFEEYAMNRLGRDRSKWGVELRQFLSGTALRTYRSIYKSGISYNNLISRLRQWCKTIIDNDKRVTPKDFWTAKPIEGEKYHEFALRLQTLYEAVVPDRERKIEELVEQYLECLPTLIAKHLRLRMGSRKINKVKWREIVAWAKEEDDDDENDQVFSNILQKKEYPVWTAAPEEYSVEKPRDYSRYAVPIESPSKLKVKESRTGKDKVLCSYCNRLGHVRENCWRISGRCLVCGSDEHKIKDCSNRNRKRETSRDSPTSKINLSPDLSQVLCFACGQYGHFMLYCDIMKQFRGGLNTAAHGCENVDNEKQNVHLNN